MGNRGTAASILPPVCNWEVVDVVVEDDEPDKERIFRVYNSSILKKRNNLIEKWVSPVQLLSHVRLFTTPWTAVSQASLSISNSWSLLKLMSIKSVMPIGDGEFTAHFNSDRGNLGML